TADPHINSVTQVFCNGAVCDLDTGTACFQDADCTSAGKGHCRGVCSTDKGCTVDSGCGSGQFCRNDLCTPTTAVACLDSTGCPAAFPVCAGAFQVITPSI